MAETSARWSVAAIGLLVGVLVCLGLLASAEFDPLTFAAPGAEDTVTTPHIVEVYGTDSYLRPNKGHDGTSFLLQALDPWYVSTEHIEHVDRPVYRAQRMLFPMIAGLAGFAPASAVPWLMGLTQAVAVGAGTLGAARLAQRMGKRPALGLAFTFSPAILCEISIGGAGVVALAAAMWGTLRVEEGRARSAGAWFAAAALAREIMLLYVAAIALHRLVTTRTMPWAFGLPPVAAVAAWGVYIRLRLDAGTGAGDVQEFDWPFQGVLDARHYWSDDSPLAWAMRAVLALALVALVGLALVQRSAVVVGSVPFAGLAAVLSFRVWTQWFDITRAVLPVFTAVVIAAGRRAAPAVVDPPERSWERQPVPITTS